VRALSAAVTLMDQARAWKHDTDLGNRLTDQAFGLLIRDREYVCRDWGARRVREDPAAAVDLVGEMRQLGLTVPVDIVQASEMPGAG
jgi:hypothetical protein